METIAVRFDARGVALTRERPVGGDADLVVVDVLEPGRAPLDVAVQVRDPAGKTFVCVRHLRDIDRRCGHMLDARPRLFRAGWHWRLRLVGAAHDRATISSGILAPEQARPRPTLLPK